MSMATDNGVHVQVTTAYAGHVRLTASDPRATASLSRAVRAAMPSARPQRRGSGLLIDARHATLLLETGGLGDGMQITISPQAQRVLENRRFALSAHRRLLAEVQALRAHGVALARNRLRDADNLHVLDDHQLVNVAAMTARDGYGMCVFDEQGAGKTVTTLFAFDTLVARNVADVLVVVAPKSMLSEWVAAVGTFMGSLYTVATIAGRRAERLSALTSDADIFVANFEAAVASEAEVRALARRCLGRAILVVDESFHIKSEDARRSQALRDLREWFGRAWVLCGTPAPNSPHDIVAQFDLVDFGITFGDVRVPADRTTALPVVRRAIRERGLYLRHLKQDVLPDLPGKRFTRLVVPFEANQAVAYAQALDDLVADLRDMDDRTYARRLTSVLARRMALLRICSNPSPLVPGYAGTPAKLGALDRLLSNLVDEHGEKVIVWSSFTASLEAILDRFAHYHPIRYDGHVTGVPEREAAIRRFQRDSDAMLFVANPAAAGAGLTLHRSRVAVYESLTDQAAHFLQSLDRIHRRGQTRDVEYIVLLCQDSIELEGLDRLVGKERAGRELLGDVYEQPPTREAILSELLAAQDLLRRRQEA
jgi:SNF2 family DNA or RNA helicase